MLVLLLILHDLLPAELLDMIVCARVHLLDQPVLHILASTTKLRAERSKLITVGYPEDDPLVRQFDDRIKHLLAFS